MGADSGVEWCGPSFSPWIGCAKVSQGCRGCYAEHQTPTRVLRARGLEVWGPASSTPRHRTCESTWQGPERWNRAAAAEGVPRAVFCAPMADVAEDHASLDPWRADLWSLVERTPWLTWLLLTKRADRWSKVLPSAWLRSPLPHVWLGASVEDQATADARLPALLATPAALHWASVEPLLGAVDLRGYLPDETGRDHLESSAAMLRRGRYPLPGASARLGWVIVGGESGPRRREMDLGAFVTIAGVCIGRRVPVWSKQDSAARAGAQGRIPDVLWSLKERPPLHVPSSAALPLLARMQGARS